MATPATWCSPDEITNTARPYLHDLGHNIYIKDMAELLLYQKWLAIPHRGLKIEAYLKLVNLPEHPPMNAGIVRASITEEQERRFAFFAERNDIQICLNSLRRLKDALEAILEVLKTEQADAMKDFDSENFRRMELEDRKDAHREALIKLKQGREV